MKTREISAGNVAIGGGNPLVLIAGPCVIESGESCMDAARLLKEICEREDIPLIFKSSYDKANRSSPYSFRGPGMEEGLAILREVREKVGVPVLTDVHLPEEAEAAAEVVDVIQIPAFLCRQTDLLLAAGRSGKPVNVKKGQFLAPGDMRNVIDKIRSTDHEDIILTERGTCFGYHYLVNDMRALPAMRKLGYPVVFDATHSVQVPGGQGMSSGGERQYVPALVRAAVAAGVDGLFVEAHQNPDAALSDGPNMLRIEDLPPLIRVAKKIAEAVREAVEAETLETRFISRHQTGAARIAGGVPGESPDE